MTFTFFDALGLTGSALFVIVFAGTQAEKMDPRGWTALMMNLIGAILILISLAFSFNLASFVLEAIWALVALYGIAKLLIRRRKP